MYNREVHRGQSQPGHSLLTLPPAVPSVPQGITARSTGSTTVLVTWTEPAVTFREHINDMH